MKSEDADELAKLVEQGVCRKWGMAWRRYFNAEVAQAVFLQECVFVVLSWPEDGSSSLPDVKAVFRACIKRLAAQGDGR